MSVCPLGISMRPGNTAELDATDLGHEVIGQHRARSALKWWYDALGKQPPSVLQRHKLRWHGGKGQPVAYLRHRSISIARANADSGCN
jgi:hypothetical protein